MLEQWYTLQICSINDIWIFVWAMIYEFCSINDIRILLEQWYMNFARAMIYEFCSSNDSLGFWWSHVYRYIYTCRAIGYPISLGEIWLHNIIMIIIIIILQLVLALTSKNHQSGLVSVSKIRIVIESAFWNRDRNLVFYKQSDEFICVGSYQNCKTIFIFIFLKI